MTLNGYDYCVRPYVLNMENVIVAVAEGLVSKELLGRLLQSVIEDDEFSDELKLELVECMGQRLED